MVSLQGDVVGEMTIGCSTASGKYLLPGLISVFRQEYPMVRVNVQVSSRESVLQNLLSGDVALGVSSKLIEHRDLEYKNFFTDDVILIVPSNHPWFCQNYDDIEANVHGGITFSDYGPDFFWKVGFDMAHVGDIIPSMFFTDAVIMHNDSYKDMEYVFNELEDLSRQAKDLLPDYEIENPDVVIAKLLLDNSVCQNDTRRIQ